MTRSPDAGRPARWRTRRSHDRRASDRLHLAAAAAGAADAADPVVAVAADPAAAAAHRLSADAHPHGNRAQGGDAGAHALVAHAAAAAAGGPDHHRGRRPGVEPAGAGRARSRSDRADRRLGLGRGGAMERAHAGGRGHHHTGRDREPRGRGDRHRHAGQGILAAAARRGARSAQAARAPPRIRRTAARSSRRFRAFCAPTAISRWCGSATASISATARPSSTN